MLEMVWPATKLRLEAVGRDMPPGYTVRKLAAVGLVTVTFRATAVAPAGRPGTVRVRTLPAPSLAWGAPRPVRVSNARAGAVPVKPPPVPVGVTALLDAEGTLVPAALVATTVKV